MEMAKIKNEIKIKIDFYIHYIMIYIVDIANQ